MAFIYIGSSYIISPDQVLRPLILLWLILSLLFVPAYRLTRDWNWASILLMIVVLGLFSRAIFVYTYLIMVLSILVILWTIYRSLHKKLEIHHVFTVINTASLVALILSLVFFCTRIGRVPFSYYRSVMEVIHARNYVEVTSKSETKPDIYFIVLDGYGRADTLQKLYGLDNSEFTGFLEQKGFAVLGNSRSNYPKTVQSIPSMLNMEYIQTLAPHLDKSVLWWLMSPWVDHSQVRNTLERIGYTTISISTDWSITDNSTTDYYYKSHPIMLSDFERFFLGVTPSGMLQPILNNSFSVATFDSHRLSQLSNFTSLIDSTEIPGPKFVFAHIILPHPPFIFSGNGEPLYPRYSYSFNDSSDYPGTSEQYRDRYVGQVLFLNSQLEKVIESILENSQTPPIIILQADHGPGMLVDSTSISDSCLAERFSIFSAYYLPGMDRDSIPEDMTSVNLFRMIFNEYFGTDLHMLENREYYPRQVDKIYDLEDVTDKIGGVENCITGK